MAKAKRRRRLGEGPSGPGDRVQGIAAVKRGSAHGVSREDYDVDELVAVVRLLRMKPLRQGTSLSQAVASGSEAAPGTQRTFANESWNARSV